MTLTRSTRAYASTRSDSNAQPDEGEIREYPRVDALTRDKEEEELRVLYRRIRTFAVGHGCSAEWPDEFAETADLVRTQFMPFYEVAAVTAADTDGQPILEIGRLADPDATSRDPHR